MQGQILQVGSVATNGLILGDDGHRYEFALAEWKVAARPAVGMTVDYFASGAFAREVYPLPPIGHGGPSAPMSVAQGNSMLLGILALGCLLLGFVIPVLPTIAAFIVGLIGARSSKRSGDSAGLVLSRIGWIGGLLVLIAEVLLLVLGFGLLITFANAVMHEMMQHAGGLQV